MISVTCPRTPDDSLIAAWCGKDKNNITDAERDLMKFLIVEQLRQAISLIVFQWQHFHLLNQLLEERLNGHSHRTSSYRC